MNPAVLPEGHLWTCLPNLPPSTGREKPSFYMGMGDGADKCIACLGARGLSPDAVFASDGFVRGQSFHGMKVETFAALRERYGEDGMAVLVCFASRLPEVIGYVKSLAEKVTLRIPDLPVALDDPKKLTEKGGIIDDFFLENHKTELASARALFSDRALPPAFRRYARSQAHRAHRTPFP